MMMKEKIKVTIWNEFLHEKENSRVQTLYPNGIHSAIAEFLSKHADMQIRTATLQEPENGLPLSIVEDTDVLLWWGHKAHDQVEDAVVGRLHQAVLAGMGIILLHSAHFSKIFQRLMGTTCSLRWREAAEKERLWNLQPSHPITRGIGEFIELTEAEMYGERFDIPDPDQLLFVSWFKGGEVFRSGCCWQRGYGRVFYFRPGHETYPIYYQADVQKVITNAIRWARPGFWGQHNCPNVPPLETL